MKKLLIAASAVALAAAMSPAVIGSVQAAPAKSSYCNMAKSQKNLVAWNAYYHCLGEAPRPSHVAVRSRREPAKDPYCNMAKTQKNLVSWNAEYHCLGPSPRASVEGRRRYTEARQAPREGRRLYAQARLGSEKSPYCNMAKTQKNLVSWNAEYHCLSR